ncbi:MAG: hypothetical protein ACRETC_07450 [Gammaproteobacteria bacterium]
MKSNLTVKLKLTGYVAALSLAGGLLAACGGGSSSSAPPPTPPPQPPPTNNSFTAFVKTQLKQPGTATPAVVNGVDFTFSDLNNPGAYCDVLPPATTGPCAGGGG